LAKKLGKTAQRKVGEFDSVLEPFLQHGTERFTDFDMLSWVMVLGFKLEPILDTSLAASKYDACFKSGQIRLENNHLASLI
jgi:hypothetical protein